MSHIKIYGKPQCPHTKRALAAYPSAEFIDVIQSPVLLDEMLKLSNGRRRIPVILENGYVTVGYNGGS